MPSPKLIIDSAPSSDQSDFSGAPIEACSDPTQFSDYKGPDFPSNPSPATPLPQPGPVRTPSTLRVLYLFAGPRRRADISEFLKIRTSQLNVPLILEERDLLQHGAADDLANEDVWKEVSTSIRAGQYDVIVASPPCNTFSRACWSNRRGPKPLRSRQFPDGFPWLSPKLKAKCELGNLLVNRALEAVALGRASPAKSRFLIEHPEDLGRTKTNGDPASIWQREDVHALSLHSEATTVVLHHCRYEGALSAKPTRFLGNLHGLDALGFRGWPRFSKGFRYQGPLPERCGHTHAQLIGQDASGRFRTAPAAAYPPGLCSDIADIICNDFTFHSHSPQSGKGDFPVAVQEAEASEAKDQPSKPPRKVTVKVPVDDAVMLSPCRASLADVEAWGVAAWGDHDVYIGREDRGRGLPASPWANPYKIVQGSRSREETLRLYEVHLMKESSLKSRLSELSGKRLICSCPPHVRCHGDSIIDLFKAHFPESRSDGLAPTRQLPSSEADQATSDEDEDGVTRPKLGEGLWGRGAPLRTTNYGKVREFHDGAGLCSPGRWSPAMRSEDRTGLAAEVRDSLRKIITGLPYRKIIASMATGHCRDNPFGEEAVGKARAEFHRLLKSWSPEFVSEEPSPGQPFYLKSLAEYLHVLGDPDWRCLYESSWSYHHGTPVGVEVRMPRTPAVYERKVRWRKYDEGYDGAEPRSRKNYSSADAHLQDIEIQFREEAALGMMREVPTDEAKREYGINLVTAALGAIEKTDDTFRVIHDATHGVLVNPRIVQRDQVRSPGIGEARVIMRHARDVGGTVFGLKGDVKMAHRRCKIRREDHGFQACQLREDTVWLNEVGTFGVGTAAYWWSRLMAAVARGCLYLHGRDWVWQLVFADDEHWSSTGPDTVVNLLATVLFQVVVGVPFSWKKFRGGFSMDWVGFWIDYTRFEVGLSESRAMWLAKWIQSTLSEGSVLIRAFGEALGRFGFASGALEYFRPFLGPLYAWYSAVPSGAYLELPVTVRIILKYILGELLKGHYRMPCGTEVIQEDDDFRADAKAEGEDVAMGGWECRNGVQTNQARWWFVRLNRKDHPWVFQGGEPFRKIATLELVATLLSEVAFGKDLSGQKRLRLTGTTDNLGNQGAVGKLMTTKFPLCAALMELASRQAQSHSELILRWAPRDQNTEADEISNEIFRNFDPALRVEVKCDAQTLPVMHEMILYGQGLYDAIKERKATGPKEHEESKTPVKGEGPQRKRRRGLKETDPW